MSHSWVELDLGALAWNLGLIRKQIGSDREVICVVKANAYGHGMPEIAHALHGLGARWFGVASVAEGAALRQLLPDAQILVLGCLLDEEIGDLLEHGLIPTVHSMASAAELNAKAQRANRHIDVHLKIDTGMGRLGISSGSLDYWMREVMRLPYLRVEGLMSHLHSSDEEDLNPTRAQLRVFEEALRHAQGVGLPMRWVHLANSNAVFRLPEAHFNMVRCGLFLYGLYPHGSHPRNFQLEPVLAWKAPVALVKDFEAGQTVSYGRTHRVGNKTKIAVVPVGYADGYDWRLSNKGKVLVRGQYAHIVGRVTMDHIMVDVGHIPGVRPNDTVTLIGRQTFAGDNISRFIGAEAMAYWLDTIPYEVVCGIGPRVRRKVLTPSRRLDLKPAVGLN